MRVLVRVGSRKVGCLMFADDIVLIADSRENLQALLDLTWEFSRKWRFEFNFDKSAVLIFRHFNAAAPLVCQWKLGVPFCK